MNNDFPHDGDNTPAAKSAGSSTALPNNGNGANANGANVNGANANGANDNALNGNALNGSANGSDIEAASDAAMRDALEDAHALFVRPAQGQGVARGMSENGISENGVNTSGDAISVAPTDYDSNDAYHRAMGLSDETAKGNAPFAPSANHGSEDFKTDSPLPVALAATSMGGAMGPPSDTPPLSVPAPVPAPIPAQPEEEPGQDIWEHLGELRSRVLKCVVAVGIAMVVTWQYRDALLGAFAAPIVKVVRAHGGHLTVIEVMDGFSVYLQTTFIAALLIVMPYVLWQVWAFIEPALTHKERRYSGVLVPFSVILFFVGTAFGFYLTPMFFEFFLQFNPPGTEAFWSYPNAATFLGKMLLVFGICFQVPVFTIFLNKTGLVSRNLLIEYWRHVVVVIFIVVAVITPTWDPFTMTAAALPPCILYGVSIWLVKWL